MMEDDVAEKSSLSLKLKDTQLESVSDLAQFIDIKTNEIEKLEKELKEAKKSLMKITDETLPHLMAELGVMSFKLNNGSSVEIKKTYGASIPLANRSQAHQWLRDNGFGDIVKNIISCNFGMGEDDRADQFYKVASEKGFVPTKKEEVHSSTLRAWVKEQNENGREFPMELFGAFIGQRAVIKGGKNDQ